MMRDEREKIVVRTRMFKMAGMVTAILFALLVGAMLLYVFRRDPAILQNLGGVLRK